MLTHYTSASLLGLAVVGNCHAYINVASFMAEPPQQAVAKAFGTSSMTPEFETKAAVGFPSKDTGPYNCAALGTCRGSGKCPEAHNTIIISDTGVPFKLVCDQNYNDGAFDYASDLSYEQCLSWCSRRSGCLMASYSHNGRSCYLSFHKLKQVFTQSGLSTFLKLSTEAYRPLQCPGDDKRQIKTSHRIYEVRCNLDSADTEIKRTWSPSYEHCADLCDETLGCTFAIHKTNEQCYLMSGNPKPETGRSSSVHVWLQPLTGSSTLCCGEPDIKKGAYPSSIASL